MMDGIESTYVEGLGSSCHVKTIPYPIISLYSVVLSDRSSSFIFRKLIDFSVADAIDG
jgi:hypothetical protein